MRKWVLPALVVMAVACPAASLAFTASYLYPLATPTGSIKTSAATLIPDPFNKELYVVADGLVHVFNTSGMEVYEWPQDEELGSVTSVAPMENGDILVLRRMPGRSFLVRANYRGNIVAELPVDGLQAETDAGFDPSNILYGKGKLYVVDLWNKRKILVVDLAEGKVTSTIDLAAKFGLEGTASDYGVDAVSMDGRGNLLFVVAPLFKVFVMAPDGSVTNFGRSGSAPGKFGIVKGVTTDDAGRIYVADILKSAVIVFEPDFKFIGEFGYRGQHPGSLLSPRDLVFSEGKLYVSQQARRGVAVYQIGN
jgi:DNA-binding beta-propeller fold protein YncE